MLQGASGQLNSDWLIGCPHPFLMMTLFDYAAAQQKQKDEETLALVVAGKCGNKDTIHSDLMRTS